ncbi:MAG TPA: hypothetical protein VG892_13915 [Terriglobales bacterium]|nr:hypothetical protein [Terriglobales bacterium]
MAEDCARGERLGWSEFVRDYSPIARILLEQYFPVLKPEIDAHVTAAVERARVNNNGWFTTFHFANEREFLMSFRELVFTYGREVARLPTPEISLDQMRDIMKDLPVVERQMLWLFVKGYDANQIGRMVANQEGTAQAVRDLAGQRVAEILPSASADAFNVSARVLIEAAEKVKSEACLPLRTFNNLINGQLSWRERELAEQHIRDCFYCIDNFTAFQEMIRIRKDVQPLPEREVEAFLARLNLPPARSKGIFSRILSR